MAVFNLTKGGKSKDYLHPKRIKSVSLLKKLISNPVYAKVNSHTFDDGVPVFKYFSRAKVTHVKIRGEIEVVYSKGANYTDNQARLMIKDSNNIWYRIDVDVHEQYILQVMKSL